MGDVVNVWVGATTDSSARVVGKVDGSSVRLVVADNEAMTSPQLYGPVSPTAQGIVSIEATGLDADTRYHFALEVDSVLDTEFPGRFRTHPILGEPASYGFWAAGDAGLGPSGGPPRFPGVGDVLAANRLSNHPVFDLIRDRDPLFGVHLGDFTYYDLGSGLHGITDPDIDTVRRMYDDLLLQPRQHRLYRDVPVVLLWDDHDYGPDNSDRTVPLRDEACLVYRERVPHYPLDEPGANPIFQSWQVGRVLHIASDVRADRDPNADIDGPGKTMLGAAQKAWMDALLAASPAEFLVWHMPDVWIAAALDSWNSFQHERDEMVEMLGDHGWLDRMAMTSADAHFLGLETGGGNRWGRFPIWHCASLDANPGGRSHRFDSGVTSPGRNRYGTFTVEDVGHEIWFTGNLWIGRHRWNTHTVTARTSTPKVVSQGVQEVSAHATVDFGEPGNPDVHELESWSVDREIATELPDQVRQTSGVSAAAAQVSIPAPEGTDPGWWSPWLRRRRSTGRRVEVDVTVDGATVRLFTGLALEASADARSQTIGLRCADDVWRLRGEVSLPAFTDRIASGFNPGMDPLWPIEHVLRQFGLTPLPLTGPDPLVVASLAGSAMPLVGGLRSTQAGDDPPPFEDRPDMPLPAMTGSPDVPIAAATWSVIGEDVEPWPDEVTVGFVVGDTAELLETEGEVVILTLRGGGEGAGRLVVWMVPDPNHTWMRVLVMDGPAFPSDVIADVSVDDLDLGLTWLVMRRDGTDLQFEAFQHGERVAEMLMPFWVTDPEIDHVQATCEGSVPLSTVQVLAWAPDKLAEPGAVLDFTSDASQLPGWQPDLWAGSDRPDMRLVGVPPLDTATGASVVRDLAHADQAGAWLAEDGRPTWRNRSSLRGGGRPVIDVTSAESLVDFRWLEHVEQVAASVQATAQAPAAVQHDPDLDVYQATQVFHVNPGGKLDIIVDLDEPSGAVDEALSGSAAEVGSRYKANTKPDGSGSEVAQIHQRLVGPGQMVRGAHRVTLLSPTRARIELENVTKFICFLVDTNGDPALFVGARVTVADGQATTVRQDTGIETPDVLDLGANPWRQDVDAARDLVRFVALEVSTPRPVTQQVRVVPDLDVTLGTIVRLHDPDVSGLSVRGLVRAVRWAGRAGEVTQTLEVQPLRPTMDEHDALMAGGTLGGHDDHMEGSTMRDHDERPIHEAV